MDKGPHLIVFDFGSVVGGTNREKLAQLVREDLDLSQDEAKDLVSAVKQWEGSKEEFWKEYARTSKKPLPKNWLERFAELKRRVIESNPSVLKIVKELRSRGYRTAILSNTTPERAKHIRSLGFYDYFDPVILSCDVGVAKPEKQAYEILLERAQLKADQCLFIDDKQENIEMAASLGFDVILFTSDQELRRELEKRSILLPETE